jgi:hypothetical protein
MAPGRGYDCAAAVIQQAQTIELANGVAIQFLQMSGLLIAGCRKFRLAQRRSRKVPLTRNKL